jgi:stress response protein YsnF
MNEEKRTDKKQVTKNIIHTDHATIPVVKEEVSIENRERTTSEVVIESHTQTQSKNIPLRSTHFGYREVRVPKGEVVDQMPAIRQEDGRYIVPVVREEEVVIKRLVLVEEVHLIPDTTTEQHNERIELRSQDVSVTRNPTD